MTATPVMDELFRAIAGMRKSGLFTKGNEIVLDEERYQALRKEMWELRPPTSDKKYTEEWLALPGDKVAQEVSLDHVIISSRLRHDAIDRWAEEEWCKGFDEGVRAAQEDAKKATKAAKTTRRA